MIFSFVSVAKWGQLLKERICSWWSKFFLVRVYPIFKVFFFSFREGYEKLKNLFYMYLEKMLEKMEVYHVL